MLIRLERENKWPAATNRQFTEVGSVVQNKIGPGASGIKGIAVATDARKASGAIHLPRVLFGTSSSISYQLWFFSYFLQIPLPAIRCWRSSSMRAHCRGRCKCWQRGRRSRLHSHRPGGMLDFALSRGGFGGRDQGQSCSFRTSRRRSFFRHGPRPQQTGKTRKRPNRAKLAGNARVGRNRSWQRSKT